MEGCDGLGVGDKVWQGAGSGERGLKAEGLTHKAHCFRFYFPAWPQPDPSLHKCKPGAM